MTRTAGSIEEKLRQTGWPTDAARLSRLIMKFILDEREHCAKLAANMLITGGETPGPLYDAGWNSCSIETAKLIREGK